MLSDTTLKVYFSHKSNSEVCSNGYVKFLFLSFDLSVPTVKYFFNKVLIGTSDIFSSNKLTFEDRETIANLFTELVNESTLLISYKSLISLLFYNEDKSKHKCSAR